MIIVVEIVGRTGDRARKEYDAPSINAAVEAARRELRAYPKFRITDISRKVHRLREKERKSGDLGPAADGVLIGAVAICSRSFYPPFSLLRSVWHHAGA